jgi:hypothetical protein
MGRTGPHGLDGQVGWQDHLGQRGYFGALVGPDCEMGQKGRLGWMLDADLGPKEIGLLGC